MPSLQNQIGRYVTVQWSMGVAALFLVGGFYFFVKLVLYPLTHKQMSSMAKMKELKPEMDKVNALYADDREKKGAAVMELYRQKGVNPMAGCFPVVLQLPTPKGITASDYQVVVGYQLSPDELARNREQVDGVPDLLMGENFRVARHL